MPPKGCRRFKRQRSTERCPWCNLRYEAFRCSRKLKDVWQDMILESQAAQAEGVFTKQARLNYVLGRLHHIKQEEWKEHKYWCKMEYDDRNPSADEEVPF